MYGCQICMVLWWQAWRLCLPKTTLRALLTKENRWKHYSAFQQTRAVAPPLSLAVKVSRRMQCMECLSYYYWLELMSGTESSIMDKKFKWIIIFIRHVVFIEFLSSITVHPSAYLYWLTGCSVGACGCVWSWMLTVEIIAETSSVHFLAHCLHSSGPTLPPYMAININLK